MSQVQIQVINERFGSWAQLCTDHLWRACWQGGLFILIAWIVCRLLPGISAGRRHQIWCLVYCKLLVGLCMPAAIPLPLQTPRPPLPRFSLARYDPHFPTSVVAQSTTAFQEIIQRSRPDEHSPMPPAYVTTLRRIYFPYVDHTVLPQFLQIVLCMVWVGGVACCLAALACQMLSLRRRLRRQARTLQQPALLAQVRDIARQVGLRHIPRIAVSERVKAPQVLGPLNPVIVLPQAAIASAANSLHASDLPSSDLLAGAYSDAELRLILTHELLHIRRGHLWWMALAAITEALLFFNPLVWLAGHEFAIAREATCDSDVLHASGASPADYARLLLKIATAKPARDTFLAALGAAVGYRALRTRLVLLQHAVGVASRLAARIVASLLIGGCIFLFPWHLTAQVRNPLGAPRYGIVRLDGFLTALNINRRGQIIGQMYQMAPYYGDFARYDGRTLTLSGFQPQLSVYPSPQGHAGWTVNSINGQGDIAGTAVNGAEFPLPTAYHALLQIHGSCQDLKPLFPDGSEANGINDAGDVVGASYLPRNPSSRTWNADKRAFLLRNGSATLLGALPGMNCSVAHAINNRGQIIGTSFSSNSSPPIQSRHGFLWENGIMKDLGPGEPLAINDRGEIAGRYFTGAQELACIWQPGSLERIVLQPADRGSRGVAWGINNAGQVVGTITNTIKAAQTVGTAMSGEEESHAFLYSDGRMSDLNDLIPAESEWLLLDSATGINEAGQIIGHGTLLPPRAGMNSSSFMLDAGAFLLTPR